MKPDILQNKLVPEHVILSDEEAAEMIEKWNINEDNLQKILPTDPVVKAIGAKEGDILKIIRDSETAGIAENYRIVRR